MPRLSEMPRPGPLTGLELLPAIQGGGPDANVGLPLLVNNPAFGGAVLTLRAPMTADLAATADADPGAGAIRWNDPDPEAATVLYVDHVDADAGDLAALLATLEVGGFLYLQGAADSAARDNLQRWQVTSVEAAAGYTKVGVALQASAGTFTDNDVLELTLQQPAPAPGLDRSTVSALAVVAGELAIDCSLGDYFMLTPDADVDTWLLQNVPQGCSIMVRFIQDATPRAITWPASFRWAGGTEGAVSTVAGAVDLLALTTHDGGATWLATLAKGFAA